MKQKTLVVYYSASGNTKYIAEILAKEVDADLLELVPKKQLNVSGVGYLNWGIRQLVKKEECELEPIPYDVFDYDLIVVGTPVWSYTLTPPLRTFLKENSFENKKVALFCCHGGNKGHTLEDLKAGMKGCICVGEIDFLNVLKQEQGLVSQKAVEWIKSICTNEKIS